MRFLSRVWLLLIASAYSLQANACDVCGSSAVNPSLGMLPYFSKDFIGLQYQYSSSTSRHPSLFSGKPDEESSQVYSSLQLWGRYHITKRFQLAAILPFIHNTNTEGTQSTLSEGLGDATLMLNFSIPLEENKNRKRLLLACAGIKLPTGKYTGIINAERNGLPDMQTGTGSWDFLVNINYTQKKEKWGYNLDMTGILTTANKEQYKFGNRLNTNVLIFYASGSGGVKIIPHAGIRCEYALHDYDNYSKKWLNEKTGGLLGFTSFGTQLLYKSLGIKTNLQLPFYQNFAARSVHSHARYEASLFITF